MLIWIIIYLHFSILANIPRVLNRKNETIEANKFNILNHALISGWPLTTIFNRLNELLEMRNDIKSFQNFEQKFRTKISNKISNQNFEKKFL